MMSVDVVSDEPAAARLKEQLSLTIALPKALQLYW
jgi:hypothetical protein